MVAISETSDKTDELESQSSEQLAARFAVLFDDTFENPNELPEIYHISEGQDDLELDVKNRRAS